MLARGRGRAISCDRSGGGLVAGLQGLELRLAGQAALPDEDAVLVEGHLRVQRRAAGRHQLRHRRDGQVAPRVVEEGHRQPLLRRAHRHPVLHALVRRVAQHLQPRTYVNVTCNWLIIDRIRMMDGRLIIV